MSGRAARNATCCTHPAHDHDTHGCAVNLSTHHRTYERCHGLVPADTTELVVPVLVHDLMRAATGNPITVSTLDGQEVVLRLCTPDEALQFEREARAKVAAMGIPVSHPGMSRARAEELCAPLDLTQQHR